MSSINFRNIINRLRLITDSFKSNRIFTYALIAISFLYPLFLIITVWDQIQQLNWSKFIGILLICVLNYLISSILQSISWSLILDGNLIDYRLNGSVYYKSMLMHRLPGGFWHWVGRSNLFHMSSVEKAKLIGHSNFIEWIGLWLTGVSVYLFFRFTLVGIFAFILAIGIVSWLIKRFISHTDFIRRGVVIMLIYAVCWVIGGYFLMWLVNGINSNVNISSVRSIQDWTIFGTVSNLFFFVPSGMLVREITLSALLADFFSAKEVLLLGVQLRLVITIADLITATTMLQVIKLVNPKRKVS